MDFFSAKEIAQIWKISRRRVILLCKEDRVEGAQMVAGAWIIPKGTPKPEDARIKNGKYIKSKTEEAESEEENS